MPTISATHKPTGMSVRKSRNHIRVVEHEKCIHRGAEILRAQILQQLDEMEDHVVVAAGNNKRTERERFDSTWISEFSEPIFDDTTTVDNDDDEEEEERADVSYEYHKEVRVEGRHGIAPCEWSVDAAADYDPPSTSSSRIVDLSKSYRLRSTPGPVKKVVSNTEEDEDDIHTMSDVILSENLFGRGEDDNRTTLLDDPEHLTFTFTDDDGAKIPIVSPEEKRQDNSSNGAFSDYRKGDAAQAERIIREIRGTASISPSSRANERSRRPRQQQQQQQSNSTPTRQRLGAIPNHGDRQTTPLRHRTQQIYTQRSSSPQPNRRRQQSVPRPKQEVAKHMKKSGGFLSRHKSAPRSARRRTTEIPKTSSPVVSEGSRKANDVSYLPLRLDASKTSNNWRPSKQKPRIFAGAPSLLDQEEGGESPSDAQRRKTPQQKQQVNASCQVEMYKDLMSDPAYVHAMQAGFLWQSLVAQHMKLPQKWWNGSRGPPMGKATTIVRRREQPWTYLARQSVLNNYVLQKLVKSRASGGRLLLHILVQDSVATTMDIVVGCFHPNANQIRDTQQALRHLETCRDVWVAQRKHATRTVVSSPLDTLLTTLDRSSRSPLGPGVRITNHNVRAVLGEKPPLETLVLPEQEVHRRLAGRLAAGEEPPMAILQEFVLA